MFVSRTRTRRMWSNPDNEVTQRLPKALSAEELEWAQRARAQGSRTREFPNTLTRK